MEIENQAACVCGHGHTRMLHGNTFESLGPCISCTCLLFELARPLLLPLEDMLYCFVMKDEDIRISLYYKEEGCGINGPYWNILCKIKDPLINTEIKLRYSFGKEDKIPYPEIVQSWT